MSSYPATVQDTISNVITRLQALVWPGTSTAVFSKSVYVLDKMSAEGTYSFPCAVVSIGSRNFDGENPDLGRFTIEIDLCFMDFSTEGGGRQGTGVKTLLGAVDVIVTQFGTASNGAAMAGWYVRGHSAPGPRETKDGKVGWFCTVTLEVIRG